MLGQGGIGVSGDLRDQVPLGGWGNQGRASWPRPGSMRTGRGALADPAANGGGIVLEERGDINDRPPLVNGGQRSFTDIVGGVRARHLRIVPHRHIFWQPL